MKSMLRAWVCICVRRIKSFMFHVRLPFFYLFEVWLLSSLIRLRPRCCFQETFWQWLLWAVYLCAYNSSQRTGNNRNIKYSQLDIPNVPIFLQSLPNLRRLINSENNFRYLPLCQERERNAHFSVIFALCRTFSRNTGSESKIVAPNNSKTENYKIFQSFQCGVKMRLYDITLPLN